MKTTLMASEDAQLWAAARVVVMHQGGKCGQCENDGSCRLFDWADTRLRMWEQERQKPYPEPRGTYRSENPYPSLGARRSEPQRPSEEA